MTSLIGGDLVREVEYFPYTGSLDIMSPSSQTGWTGSRPGLLCLGIYGGPNSFLLGQLLFPFLSLTLRVYYFKPHQLPSQPLAEVGVGKGCIVSWIGCDFHVATRGWFDWGYVTIKRLVIMTTFRFSRPIRLLLLLPLGTSSGSYFVFLYS